MILQKMIWFPVFLIALTSLLQAGEPYIAKDYSYLIGKVPGFSEKLLQMHFTLYQGYVKNTNMIIEMIRNREVKNQQDTLALDAIKRRLGWEMDGMILHELYFDNLGGKKALIPNSLLHQKMIEYFGSMDQWKKDFQNTGLARGVGWVILYFDGKTQRLCNSWVSEHDVGHIAGGIPLLVMDVWEHAYITEYELNRQGYMDAFFSTIDWEVVQNRLLTCLKTNN